ncbi:extracellular solute-binding protein [Jeotgalibaca caeni]|uniref:extracellular solute-binding protein n=1 Tax=Jeotgalibaca caeni TaxID=3028623 RepID=UPI00237E7892|nr:extracellular solute-binding protein [Jeotgalibaca caeni]MDE1547593.1 extracellular solute-binding protein [Jeotgalibaca caeni]
MNFKKIVTTCGAVLLSSLVLGACGEAASSSGETSGSTTAAEFDASTVTLMVPFIETTPPEEDNAILEKMEEYTGKDIQITWVPNPSYADKMNITLASDDIPQIMVIQGKDPGFIKSAESGTFWELSEYLDDYPNLSQANPEVLESSSVNGEIYGIYRSRDLMRSTAIFRKDWLEKLGLEAPKTVEELYNVAKAFTEEDPDGNGVDDTTGIIIPNFAQAFDLLNIWFGAGNGWKEVDGELIPSFMTEEYLESIQFARKMAEEGLINRDFATLSSDKWNDPFINGTGGIILDTHSRAATITNTMNTDEVAGQDFVTITGNLAGPDGNTYAQPTAGYSGFLAIPKSSVQSEEHLRAVLDFIDKTNDAEMQVLMNNGIEGVNFTVEDEYSVAVTEVTPEIEEINTAIKSYSQMGTNVTEESHIYTAKPATEKAEAAWKLRKDLEARDLEFAVFNPAAAYVTETYATKGAQLDQIITDARVQYIAGQIDENGWKDAIELWKQSGGEDLIAETNELHQANN